MIFSVSVVIPAHNVEQFIGKAIYSALEQPEVIEIVVVNDGSIDGTLKILKKIQNDNPIVKILQHNHGINKGRSATRNLGIQNANGNYIAFLDADDYYLKDRFTKDKNIFDNDKTIEGVYNAVGFHYYKTVSETEKNQNKISTISKQLIPEELFDAVISSKYGYLHLNGLTVKKSIFDKIGYFDESLLVAEDSNIIYKMALKCKLLPGSIDVPLALRGIHDNNIFTKNDLYKIYNLKLYESIIYWASDNKVSINHIDTTLKYLWIFKYKLNEGLIKNTYYWAKLFLREPVLLFSYLSIKYFPLIRLRQVLFPFFYNNK